MMEWPYLSYYLSLSMRGDETCLTYVFIGAVMDVCIVPDSFTNMVMAKK